MATDITGYLTLRIQPEFEWTCKNIVLSVKSAYVTITGTIPVHCRLISPSWNASHAPWLPSTRGLVPPSRAFLPKQGIKEVFGDTVPYFEGNLPENIQSLLGIRSDITVEDLLDSAQESFQQCRCKPGSHRADLLAASCQNALLSIR